MIKKIGLIFLIILIMAISLIITFISKPEWFLSEAMIKRAVTSFLSEDDSLTWDKYNLKTTFTEKGVKKLNLNIQNLCYKSKKSQLSYLCFKSVYVVVDIKIALLTTENRIAFSQLQFLGGTGSISDTIREVEDTASKISIKEINDQLNSSVGIIRNYFKGNIKIELLKLNIRNEMNVKLLVNGFDDIKINIAGLTKGSPNADLTASIVSENQNSRLAFSAMVKLDNDQELNLKLTKTIHKKMKMFEGLESSILFTTNKHNISLELKGLKEKLLINKVKVIVGDTYTLHAPECLLSINQVDLYEHSVFTCDKYDVKLMAKDKLKSNLSIDGKLMIMIKNLAVEKSKIAGILNIESDINIEKVSQIKLSIKDDFLYGQSKIKYPNFKLIAKSKNIQKFYPYLKPYGLVPPAPFYELSGDVEVTANNEILHDEISFLLQTNLSSLNQYMVLNASGKVYPNDPKVNAQITFEKVKLVAPDINLLKKFSIIPSSSISLSKKVYKAENHEKKNPFNYNIQLKTVNPILIKNSVTDNPVPISLDLELSNTMKGVVAINNYNLVLFRRSAFIEYAMLKQSGTGEEELDAKIRIDHAQYKIYITVVGTPQSPNVIFESTPPLSRDDIISVLLYGKPLDEGNFDQASSVANTSLALSDKLMGAASLFLFASTPINSVRYDPESESVKASFSLGSSTTFSVGSNGNKNTSGYGLQKKLDDNLYFDTELINDSLEDQSYLIGMLKWIMRY